MTVGGRSLRLRGIDVNFSGQSVLSQIDLDCAAGDFVAIIGPSGCGKSTLLRVIAGLQQASAGTMEFGGSTPSPSIAGETSFVFQEPALMPWRNILDNIGLPVELRGGSRAAARTAARAALSMVGLHPRDERKFPRMLSGGMRMRASLARAIVTKPRLMLLDEPLAAVDDVLREQLLEQLLELWQANQWTAIFVTHNVAEAAFLSRRVLIMKRHPGTFVREIAIPFAYPRLPELRDTAEFAGVTGSIRRALREVVP